MKKNLKNQLIGFVLLLVVCFSSQQSCPSYDEYLTMFKKSYDAEEKVKRKVLYEAQCQIIEKKNSENTLSYRLGYNEMTDWSPEEIKARRNLIFNSTTSPNKIRASISVGVQTSLDWRTKNAVTSIKNQGLCGSCWAFAAAAFAESRLIIFSNYSNQVDLSEQYVLQCTQQSSCAGGYMEYAMVTVGKGMPTETQYPYRPFSNYVGICSETNKIELGSNNTNYYDLSDTQIIVLLQTQPVSASISAQGWNQYASGIFSCPSNAAIDHGILIVGYTPDYWIIKNQWGTTFGENGYIRITRSRINNANCLIGRGIFVLWAKYLLATISLGILTVIIY